MSFHSFLAQQEGRKPADTCQFNYVLLVLSLSLEDQREREREREKESALARQCPDVADRVRNGSETPEIYMNLGDRQSRPLKRKEMLHKRNISHCRAHVTYSFSSPVISLTICFLWMIKLLLLLLQPKVDKITLLIDFSRSSLSHQQRNWRAVDSFGLTVINDSYTSCQYLSLLSSQDEHKSFLRINAEPRHSLNEFK